jgi:hypothetical protein
MFFSISKQAQENFSNFYQLGPFHISTDSGWKQLAVGPVQILYKGYADAGPLESLLDQVMCQSTPHFTGNFCALIVVHDTLTIQSDQYRGFPIYIDSAEINNLTVTDRTAWADSLITVHADLTVTENKFDVIGKIDTTELSFQQAQDQVHDILTRKTRQFLTYNTSPLKVFLSGGVDTMLVYSYLYAADAKFELLDHFHFDHDYFWRANSDKITQYWAYKQTHHWRDPCVLMSGAPGDEFMLRNPVTGNQYLQQAGTSINALVKPHHMQHDYIKLEKNQLKLTDSVEQLVTKEQLHHQLCNMMVNDWQHWHLGNTLHWTPLRDLEILKIIMRLPLDRVADQIVNSDFSTALIERNMPGGSKLISSQKNTGPVLKNLGKLFDQ